MRGSTHGAASKQTAECCQAIPRASLLVLTPKEVHLARELGAVDVVKKQVRSSRLLSVRVDREGRARSRRRQRHATFLLEQVVALSNAAVKSHLVTAVGEDQIAEAVAVEVVAEDRRGPVERRTHGEIEPVFGVELLHV